MALDVKGGRSLSRSLHLALGIAGASIIASCTAVSLQPAYAEGPPQRGTPAKSKSGPGAGLWPLTVLEQLTQRRAPARGKAARPSAKSSSRSAATADKPRSDTIPRPVPKPALPPATAMANDVAPKRSATAPIPVAKPIRPEVVETVVPEALDNQDTGASPPVERVARNLPSPRPKPGAAPKSQDQIAPSPVPSAGKSDQLAGAAAPVDRSGKLAGFLLAPITSSDIPQFDQGRSGTQAPPVAPVPANRLRPSLAEAAPGTPAPPVQEASLSRFPLPRVKPKLKSPDDDVTSPPPSGSEAPGSGGAPVTPKALSWPAADVTSATAACAAAMAGLDIDFKPLGPIGGPGGCGTPYPVLVSRIAGVALKPAATMNCQVAVAMHQWLVTSVQPTATKLLGERVTGLGNASSYVCRRRYGATRGKMSEHAYAGAFDVGAFFVASGKTVGVMSPNALIKAGFQSNEPASFLDTVRAGACKQFSTVLGPGYNEAHATHFHFDLGRGGRYLICK